MMPVPGLENTICLDCGARILVFRAATMLAVRVSGTRCRACAERYQVQIVRLKMFVGAHLE